MNGATAEPLASTIKPPSTTMTSKIGINQYFLRIRIYAHSSIRNDMAAPAGSVNEWVAPSWFSELVVETFRLRTGRISVDPVASVCLTGSQSQVVLGEPPHERAHRRYHRVEQERE